MLLLVGLGNPGPKYERTRHNIGFMVADEIVASYGLGPYRSRFQGLVSEGTIAGEKVMVLKPLTYMNESGRAVGEALRFYKLTPEQIIVIYDEIDLKGGKTRVKRGGGAGGHNGIRSIDAHIGKDYWRVRLGGGHPGDKAEVKNHVLQEFAKAEREGWVAKLVPAVADEIDLMIKGDDKGFMSRVANAVFPPPPKPPAPKPSADAGPPPENESDG